MAPRWLGAIAVLVLFCAPLFVGLGQADLHGDEPIYAFAVDLMVETGDWWTPRAIPNETAPFLEKPPLKFWIVAAGIRSGLLPHNEFGQRFWDGLFGAVAFLYVYAIGTRMAGPVCGFVAVFILFVQRPLLLEHGLRSSTMEAALVLSYCGGIWHALAWASTPSRLSRSLHPFAVVLFFVLGFMTKFVAAVFLPAILIATLACSGAWRARLRNDWRVWVAAVTAGCAIVAPWFVYQSTIQGRAFWRVILAEHVVRRMTTFLEPSHVQPWHFYIAAINAEIASNKTIILVICGVLVLGTVTVRRRWDTGALVLAWLVVPLVAISFGSSKLFHYTYPFLPPLALAAGYLPALLLHWDSPAAPALQRLFRGVPLSRWTNVIRTRIVALRGIATVLAVAAFAVAVVTLVTGRFEARLGDITLLRNSSVARPALFGLALLLLSFGTADRRAVLAVLLAAVLPLAAYNETLGLLRAGRAPVKLLTECLAGVADSGERRGIYVHADDFGYWEYVYYFRRVGWDRPAERPAEALPRKLFTPRAEQPVLLSVEDYASLERSLSSGIEDRPQARGPSQTLHGVARVRLDDERILLLPGRYASCASRPGGLVGGLLAPPPPRYSRSFAYAPVPLEKDSFPRRMNGRHVRRRSRRHTRNLRLA